MFQYYYRDLLQGKGSAIMKAENFKICNQQAVDQRKPMVSSSPIPRPSGRKLMSQLKDCQEEKEEPFFLMLFYGALLGLQ